MTISILGCGWLGLPLGESLVRRGYRVKGSTTTPEKLERIAGAGIEPFLVRLDAAGEALDADSFFDADALFLNVPPSRRRADVEAWYAGCVEQAAAAVEAARVGFVVFAGSTSVYPDLGRLVAEDDAGEPEAASGRALLAAERRLQAGPFDVTVLRYAGLYGYDRQPGRFLAGRTGLAGADAPVNLVHRDDAVAVAAAVLERGVRGEVFNVCADAHPPRGVFYTREALKLGLAPPAFTDEAAPFKVVDNSRLKARLGYRFRHPDPLAAAP